MSGFDVNTILLAAIVAELGVLIPVWRSLGKKLVAVVEAYPVKRAQTEPGS